MDVVDLALVAARLVLAALIMGWYPSPRRFNLANMEQLLWYPRAVLRRPEQHQIPEFRRSLSPAYQRQYIQTVNGSYYLDNPQTQGRVCAICRKWRDPALYRDGYCRFDL